MICTPWIEMIDNMHIVTWNDWLYAHFEYKWLMICTLWINQIYDIHTMNWNDWLYAYHELNWNDWWYAYHDLKLLMICICWIEMIEDMHTIHWNDWYYAHYKLNWFELIYDKPTINWNPSTFLSPNHHMYSSWQFPPPNWPDTDLTPDQVTASALLPLHRDKYSVYGVVSRVAHFNMFLHCIHKKCR